MSQEQHPVLGDLLLETKDGDWGKGEPSEGLVPYRVIRATDFATATLGQVDSVPLRFLHSNTVERRTLQANDILIETAGGSPKRPTGRTMLVTQNVLDAFDSPVTCASFARFMRPNPALVDARYLYWFLQSLYQSGEIEQHQVQHTGVARFQYTKFAAQQRVPLPHKMEQQAIAEVLGALDDKITANTKLADTAHALLQAAYQGLTIPQGSASVRVEALVQRLTPKRKFVPDELKPSGDFPVFDQSESGFLGYLDGEGYLKASPDEPVLYFGDHTCQLRISSEKFTVGPNTVPFTGVGIPSLALYCALSGLQRHEEYKRHWQLLMKKEVRLPDEATVNTFSRIHTPLLTVFKETREQNRTLVVTRDALLPQLMSGKLRVKDIENTMGEMV